MPATERALALVLVALGCWCVVVLARGRPHRVDPVLGGLLVGGSVWWLFTSRAYEGPTVLALTSTRGLTAVDLAVLPSVCLGVAVAIRWWRPRV